MAIVQENRFDAPQPEVHNTEYGATYVNAATESPIVEAPVEKKEEEAPAVEAEAEKVEEPAAEVEAEESAPTKKPAKKAGRPKKK